MKKSGLLGLLGIAVIGGGLFAFSKILPHLFKIILAVGLVGIAAVIALVVVGLVFAFKGSSEDAKKNKKNSAPIDDNQSKILSNGREALMELRRLSMRVKDKSIHVKANNICQVIDKILQTLRQKPEKIEKTRQFFNYYLPTLSEILTKYRRIEDSGVPHDDIKEKVDAYLDDIKAAMDKQYANLFADDVLDMTVDMEAMKMAIKRDGLIADENVEYKEGGTTINLTL